MAINKYQEVVIDGINYVEFLTGGKYEIKVLVDKRTWDEYLYEYHWTAIKNNKGTYFTIKSSRDKHSVRLHKVIVEHEYSELDYWGNTIDHINNDTTDNRLVNLRIFNSKLNPTNVRSKFRSDNNHLIHVQKRGGYKVHTNVFDETIYKHFRTLEQARKYRDEEVIPYIELKIIDMKKKTRDIEFERGLRDKLANNEYEEVLEILSKYGFIVQS